MTSTRHFWSSFWWINKLNPEFNKQLIGNFTNISTIALLIEPLKSILWYWYICLFQSNLISWKVLFLKQLYNNILQLSLVLSIIYWIFWLSLLLFKLLSFLWVVYTPHSSLLTIQYYFFHLDIYFLPLQFRHLQTQYSLKLFYILFFCSTDTDTVLY